MRLPDRRFTAGLLRRGFYLWVGARLLVALAGGGGVESRALVPLAPRATVLLVFLTGFLGLLEARRRNEHLLLANFGVPEAGLAGLGVVPALVAETVVWLVARP